MAIQKTTDFHVTPSGSNSNGGGFNWDRSGRTKSRFDNYCYGSSYQVISYNNLYSNGASLNTLRSDTRSFVTADIGHIINLSSGTNLTPGFYEIISVSSGIATLDRNCWTAQNSVKDGVGVIGGTLADPYSILFFTSSGQFTCTIFIKEGEYVCSTAGMLAALQLNMIGYSSVIGDRGKATLVRAINDYLFADRNSPWYNFNVHFYNIIFKNAEGYDPTYALFNLRTDSGFYFNNCIFDGIQVIGGNYTSAVDSVFKNRPSSATGIYIDGLYILHNCFFYNCHGNLVKIRPGGVVSYCIFNCPGSGWMLYLSGSIRSIGTLIHNCVFYGSGSNSRTGIEVFNSYNLIMQSIVISNCIFNNLGNKGINNSDQYVINIRNNAFYNNTSGNYNVTPYGYYIEASNVNLTASPFIDAANGDFRLNNLPGGGALCRAAGIGPVGQTSALDIGAVQTVPPETTPAGTLVYFIASDNNPPATNFARPTYRNGHLLLNFSDSSTESAIFTGVMPSTYYNRGVSVIIYWAAATSTNTSHAVRWGAQFEALKAGGHDLDADDFAAAKYALGNPPSESGQVVKTQIDFGNGVDIDDVVAGDAFRLRIFRDGADSNDTMSGDAQLLVVEIVEGV